MSAEKTPNSFKNMEALASDISAEIWNSIVERPEGRALRPQQFADLFEVVNRALVRYRKPLTDLKNGGDPTGAFLKPFPS